VLGPGGVTASRGPKHLYKCELLAKAAETYVIFNNYPAGQAVANSLELLHMLKPESRPSLPPGLLAAFPPGEIDGRNGNGGHGCPLVIVIRIRHWYWRR
jgi:hypothetical protein